MNLFAFLPTVGFPEMAVICVVGVLLFGKRLPEIGRAVGKSIVEFKKGISGIEDEIDDRITENKKKIPPVTK